VILLRESFREGAGFKVVSGIRGLDLLFLYFFILSFFPDVVCFGYKGPRATIRIGSAGPAGLFGLGYMHNIQSL
jgi:hypothetical protein